jgi:hypothetical protein
MIEEKSLSKAIDGLKHGLQKMFEQPITVTNSKGGLNAIGN